MLRAFLIAVCTAGLASPIWADGIFITGEAEMGLVGGSRYAPEDNTQFMTSVDLNIRGSRRLDNGLTVGFEANLSDLLERGSATWPPEPTYAPLLPEGRRTADD